MELAFNEPIDPHADPKSVVYDILSHVFNMREKLGLPMESFIEAPARLKRMGVTFLVKLEQFGKQELVPLRVENTKVMYTRFCLKEDMASWRGKFVHSISVKSGQTIGDLFKRVALCLKTSFHRFMRKIQKNAHKNNIRLAKEFARTREHCEPFRRVHSHQMCHH